MINQDLAPVYLKLANRICDKILSEKYKPEERIPSIRDLAADNEVNPNTVMRTFEYLQQKEIIYNKRGMGYFVSSKAKELISSLKKDEFIKTTLPYMFKTMQQLNIDIEEIINEFKEYKTQSK